MQQYYGDEPHLISKRRQRSAKKSKYRLSKALVFATGLCFLVAIVFSFMPQQKQLSQPTVTIKGANWYFVAFASSTTYEQAEMDSEDVREAGGSGYIINDGEYKVTGAVYAKKKDAQAVAEKQSKPASVYELKIPTVKITGEPDDSVLSAFSLYKTVISDLGGVLDDFSQDKTTDALLWHALEKVKSKVASSLSAVKAQTGKTEGIVAAYLEQTINALSVDMTEEKGVALARLRYALCETVYLRYTLTETLTA